METFTKVEGVDPEISTGRLTFDFALKTQFCALTGRKATAPSPLLL